MCMFYFPTMKNQPLSIANVSSIFLLFSLLLATSAVASAGGLYDYVNPGWGNGRCKILNNGGLLKVTLDKVSGSGFESKKSYIYAKIDMQIKLVPGNSAGTVTTFYLSSKGNYHDEIDFEFLGNVTGQPYTLHTNVFCQGKGKREQQFRLWFDPTTDFHTYTILWTPKHIVFLVDGIAIREFKNWEKYGIPFPTYQPMKLYASLWNADQWATRGGLVKTDWSKAPFNAYFKNYNDQNACIWYGGSATSCTSNSLLSPFKNNAWLWETLDYGAVGKMKWMQQKYMIYDYCKDRKRFPQGLPKECYLNNDANY